ncbi:putative Transmembrane protein [Melia azedarach]|uniref:Transmembrane protein n=1 Tax=Melia azedarach TaxID=155640 RepID=A0ACC1XCE7_MELAZ|nr:putative Transmembrane protein [Melia azedarach]
MGSGDEVVEIDSLERGLLSDKRIKDEVDDDTILYTASFQEKEDNFVKYQTVQWLLYSLLLILAWGIGLFMLLYLPVRRYILRKDIQSRKLYVTQDAIVYEVTRPVPFPCFGVLKKEKHVLLPSVRDIVIEQGYLQSLFGVYSLRIENIGVRRPPSDDVQIQGVANPSDFRKAVLTRLSNMRSEAFSRQASAIEEIPNPKTSISSLTWLSASKPLRHDSSPYSGDLALLQKLEEVGCSVKRVQTLIEEQHCQTSEPVIEDTRRV